VPYDGVYIVHERSSGVDPMWFLPSQDATAQPTMLDSILETVAIGELTGATVVATHIKARGVNYWGKSAPIIDVINRARTRGVRIWADQYPYTTSGSDGLVVLLPYWVLNEFDGETQNYADALNSALRDPVSAARVREDVAHQIARRGGEDQIYVLDHPEQRLIGKSIGDIARSRGVTAVDVALQFQYEGFLNRFGGVRVRGFSLDEADVTAFMKESWVATASDSGIATVEDGPVHARHYGTFPRKIHEYAIRRGVVSVEQAIRSMTSLPADIMGFAHRGRIAPEQYADIVVVDIDRFQDLATFINPHQFPAGVEYVLVNGQKAVDQGTLTWALPGQVLMPDSVEHTD
jgi:N-acyl-D-amino-acid deacylase